MVGDGSYSNPYKITTATDLQNVNNNLSAYYELANDIDCSSISNFIPIGDTGNAFTGHFDGKNYTISKVTITNSRNFLGLFGYLQSGTVLNFKLDTITINGSGATSIGSVFGKNLYGDIENIRVSNINITGNFGVGGFVGQCCGNINNCSVDNGTITATSNYVGGFVGWCSNGYVTSNFTIVFCYSCGVTINCQTTTIVGGFAGVISDAFCIKLSYCKNIIYASNSVGGFIGVIDKQTHETYIFNNYSASEIHTSGANSDIFAYCDDKSLLTFHDNYADKNISIVTADTFSIGKTTSQMKVQATYVNWDFTTQWTIDEGINYPTLQALPPPVVVIVPKTVDIDSILYLNTLYLLDSRYKELNRDTILYNDILNYNNTVTKCKQTIYQVDTNLIDSSNTIIKAKNVEVSIYLNNILETVIRQLGKIADINITVYTNNNYISNSITKNKSINSTLYNNAIEDICTRIAEKCVSNNIDINNIELDCVYNKVKNKDVLSYINVVDSNDTIITQISIHDVQAFISVISNKTGLTIEEINNKLNIDTSKTTTHVEVGTTGIKG